MADFSGHPVLACVHDDDGSALSKKFGPGLTNYYSGSPLNRVSFLREDHGFISAAFSSPDAQFIVLHDFSPLVQDSATIKPVGREDILSITGENPFGSSEKELMAAFDSTVTKPLIIFLGIWEDPAAGFQHRTFCGKPWFAVDATPRGSFADAATALIDSLAKDGCTFLKSTRQNTLRADFAAMYGQARGIVDWNLRNQFCAGCGHPTTPVYGGYKRVCPPTDLNGTATPVVRKECPTRNGITNISFPRSDPTMIAAVVSADGKRMLLGRQKRWPAGFYSTLAGFLEPGESVEEGVRREVWEESGVKVGRVVLHSSQPWPYPASLMLGAVASALPDGEDIHLGHDPELEDAKWVPLEEVREALKKTVTLDTVPVTNGDKPPTLLLPPHTAIANRLITAICEGYAGEA